jgi:outer membrane protein assembly factor BamB
LFDHFFPAGIIAHLNFTFHLFETNMKRDSFFCLTFIAILLVPACFTLSDEWPQWRGPSRSGHAPPHAPVPASFPEEPKVIWKIKTGPGHSGPVVSQGKLIYTDEQENMETVHVLDAATGEEIWQTPYGEAYQDEFGMGPRATPLVDQDRVYLQSVKGEFRCFSLKDGQQLWRTHFEEEFGALFLGIRPAAAAARRRGNAGSAIIDEDRIIVPVGSTNNASLVCFNKFDGSVIWKSQSDEAAYSSFMIETLAGVKQLIAYTGEGLISLDPVSGKLFWRVPLQTAAKRHVTTPVFINDTIYVASHTFGMVAIRVSNENGQPKASELWANRALKINVSTPIAIGEHLYGIGPSRNFICIDGQTGKIHWSQPGFTEFGSTFAVGNKLLVLTELGELILMDPTPDAYREISRFHACGKTWSFPAYVNGKIFVRDQRDIACLDLLHSN